MSSIALVPPLDEPEVVEEILEPDVAETTPQEETGPALDEVQDFIASLVPYMSIALAILCAMTTTTLELVALSYLTRVTLGTALLTLFVSFLGWGVFFARKIAISVDATKNGVVKQFGRRLRIIREGLRLLWWPLQTVSYVPRAPIECRMLFQRVVTLPGHFVSPDGTEKCERLSLGIEFAVYWKFGDDAKNLFETAAFLPPHILASQNLDVIAVRLTEFIDSDAENVVRGVLGEYTWANIVNRKGDVKKAIMDALVATVTGNLAGLADFFDVAILDIIWPPGLEAQAGKAIAIENAETTRRNAEAERDRRMRLAEAERFEIEQRAEANKKSVELAAVAEATELTATLTAELDTIGLTKPAERASYQLARRVAERFPQDANFWHVGGDVGDGLKSFMGSILKLLKGAT